MRREFFFHAKLFILVTGENNYLPNIRIVQQMLSVCVSKRATPAGDKQ
jgi:hypothetical protein